MITPKTIEQSNENEILTKNISACNSVAELKNVLNNIPGWKMKYSTWIIRVTFIIERLDEYLTASKQEQDNYSEKEFNDYLTYFTRKHWLRAKVKELIQGSNQLWDLLMMEMQYDTKINISEIIENWNKHHLNINLSPEVHEELQSLFLKYPDSQMQTNQFEFMWEKLLRIEVCDYENIRRTITVNTSNWKGFNVNFPSSFSTSEAWNIETRFKKEAVMLYNNWNYSDNDYEWVYHLPHMLVDTKEWKPLIIEWTNYAITHINDRWSLVEFHWDKFYLVTCCSDDGSHKFAYVNKDFKPLMYNDDFYFNERYFTIWVNNNIRYCSSNLKDWNCHL